MLVSSSCRISRWLHWLFLAIAGGFGLALIYATPPNGASDEISHQVKVVRVAYGNLLGADRSLLLPDLFAWHGAFDDKAVLDPHRSFSKAELVQALRAPLACKRVTTYANDAIAPYGPLPYVAPALIYRASCALGASYGAYLHAARIANFILAGALAACGIALAGIGKWSLFSVALLPDTMCQLVAVSADAMLFGLCFALIGIVSAIAARRLRPAPGLLLALSSGLAITLTKPGYFWLAWLPLALVPIYRAAGWSWLRFVSLVLLAPLVLQAAMVAVSRDSLPVVAGVDPAEQLGLLLTDPCHFVAQLIHVPAATPIGTQWSLLDTLVGLSPWMDTRLSPALCAALYAGLVLSMGLGLGRGLSAWARLCCAVLVAVSIVVVCLPLYAFATPTHNTAIFGLQGRYFIPTLAVLLLAFSFPMAAPLRRLAIPLLLALPCVALSQTLALVHWRYFRSLV